MLNSLILLLISIIVFVNMGILYIVATPIGNLEDITIRSVKTLYTVDYIACEDTRVTSLLLSHLVQKYTSILYSNVVKPKLISYYDEIEFKRVPEIIELLQGGKDVALVSDSGTPLISDPGYKIVQECIKRDIRVIPIPGPSSVVTALTASGLPPDQFLFLGYLPQNQNKRLKLLLNLQQRYNSRDTNVVGYLHPTVIFFESPHRLNESLKDLKEVFGDIKIVIARELTKIHEEIWRGKISNTINLVFKGELVILFNIPQE